MGGSKERKKKSRKLQIYTSPDLNNATNLMNKHCRIQPTSTDFSTRDSTTALMTKGSKDFKDWPLSKMLCLTDSRTLGEHEDKTWTTCCK